MTFLDKKEQVIDIELTQHGKRLLSRGELKPVYYAFFDDDVLYDSEYGGFEENRNDAGERIRNETPTTSVQYVFSGIESEVRRAIAHKRTRKAQGFDDGITIQGTAEKHYAVSAPLGNSSISDSEAPSWSVNVLKGEITGSVQVVTGSQPNTKIPQLNMSNVTLKTEVVGPTVDGAELPSESEDFDYLAEDDGTLEALNSLSARFEDGSFIKVVGDFLLLDISEENVDSLQKNFDIEVFMQETDDKTGQDILVPLFFDVKRELVVNDILVDQDDTEPLENRSLDPSYVDHFFHVYVDDEISRKILCEHVPASVLEANFPADVIDCVEPTGEAPNASGLYDSDVRNIEEC